MATKAQIEAAAQAFVAQQLPTIIPQQNKRMGQGQLPFQGLLTSLPPDDGALTTPTLSSKPTDRNTTWAQEFPTLPLTGWPCSLQIDCYSGPLGVGWTLKASATKAGVTLTKTWAFGPETSRGTDWIEVPTVAVPATSPGIVARAMAATRNFFSRLNPFARA